MSRCPGYVAVTVDDWSTSEELFHQDVVVLCPLSEFNVTFYLPHRALVNTNNRTFLVTLSDTARRHDVFVTAVQLPRHSEHAQRHISLTDDHVTRQTLRTRASLSRTVESSRTSEHAQR